MLKAIAYIICVLVVVFYGLFSCSDHRIPSSNSPINCQLVQATIQSSFSGVAGSPARIPSEHVTLDETNAGSPLPLGLPNGDFYEAEKISYTFSGKGQLIEQVRTASDYLQTNLWRNQYEYTDKTITLRIEWFWDGKQVHSATGFFTLDEKGRIATGRLWGTQRTYTYDKEGKLIRVVEVDDTGATQQKDLEYTDGNVVKVLASGPAYEQTLTYEYDLARPALPTFGNDLTYEVGTDTNQDTKYSRNLVRKKTDFRTYKQNGIPTSQMLNTTLYTYSFDAQNRVSRQLVVQTFRFSWLDYPTQISNSAAASLVDFTYSCP